LNEFSEESVDSGEDGSGGGGESGGSSFKNDGIVTVLGSAGQIQGCESCNLHIGRLWVVVDDVGRETEVTVSGVIDGGQESVASLSVNSSS